MAGSEGHPKVEIGYDRSGSAFARECVVALTASVAGIALIVERKFGVSVLHSVFETVWGAFNSIGRDTS